LPQTEGVHAEGYDESNHHPGGTTQERTHGDENARQGRQQQAGLGEVHGHGKLTSFVALRSLPRHTAEANAKSLC
jgi:hypothetical protein